MMNFKPCYLNYVCYLVEEISSGTKIASDFPSGSYIIPLLIQPGQESLVEWTSPFWKTVSPRPIFVSPYGLECIRNGMLSEFDVTGYQVINYRTGEKLGCL